MAPSRLWPVLATPILSPLGKLRLAWERFTPPRRDESDESLAQFATRRLGREVYERLVQPLVGGIYTADPEKLSIRATMPRFVEMERKHGSMLRAARQERGRESNKTATDSGARYSMFVAPRDGMSSLVDAIVSRLPRGAVRLKTTVERTSRDAAGGWRLALASTTDSSGRREESFDAVICALPAHRAAAVVAELDRGLAAELSAIEHAGAAVVSLAYEREQIAHPLDGFGFVVPLVEKRRILSASFSSVKYAGRAPDGKALVRVFVGGACQRELLDLDDAALRQLAHEELAALVGIRGPAILSTVTRWDRTMPQYHVGHVERVERIESAVARHAGLALCGNAYRGVGVPQCVYSGEQAAESVADYLHTLSAQSGAQAVEAVSRPS
jgi:oxygen-dependent protoporphyrinogen oxidase